MSKMNIDLAMDELVSALKGLTLDSGETIFRSVRGRFYNSNELATCDYPAAMAGFESITTGEQNDEGDVLLLCLVRGRRGSLVLPEIRQKVAELLERDFDSEDAQVDSIELGDLFPGKTEAAETNVLPAGAYISAWLGIAPPANGFYTTFKIAVEAD